MSLSHEHVGPKILGKIKIYVLTRAELLFPLCYEIPCTYVGSLFCTFVLYSTQRTNFCKLMIQSYLVLSRLINLVSTKEDFLLQNNKPPPCITTVLLSKPA